MLADSWISDLKYSKHLSNRCERRIHSLQHWKHLFNRCERFMHNFKTNNDRSNRCERFIHNLQHRENVFSMDARGVNIICLFNRKFIRHTNTEKHLFSRFLYIFLASWNINELFIVVNMKFRRTNWSVVTNWPLVSQSASSAGYTWVKDIP